MDDPLARLAVLNRTGRQRVQPKLLAIGSDVEIAARVNQDLSREYGEVVHAEGQFWRYNGTHWQAILEHELRLTPRTKEILYCFRRGFIKAAQCMTTAATSVPRSANHHA